MIRRLSLVGDPVARGRAHGRTYAADIRRYTEERVRLSCNGSWAGRPTTRDDVLALAERMLPAHRDYDPDLFAEMVGMADAAGISAAEAVIVGGFTDFVDAVRAEGSAPYEDDCTAVLVPEARGERGGWLTQTWDMHDSATEHVVMLELPDAKVFTTVGCVGQIGMNAAGIAVGIDNLTVTDGRIGVTWPFVVRKVLAQRTFDDALRCVVDAPVAGGHAFLILDPDGRGAVVELTPTHTSVVPLEDHVLAHTNHLLNPEGKRREAVRPAELQASSVDRLDRALDRCRDGVLGYSEMVALTRDPAIARRSEAPFHVETSGAVVMRPKTRELWAVWRLPSEHPYERFVV